MRELIWSEVQILLGASVLRGKTRDVHLTFLDENMILKLDKF